MSEQKRHHRWQRRKVAGKPGRKWFCPDCWSWRIDMRRRGSRRGVEFEVLTENGLLTTVYQSPLCYGPPSNKKTDTGDRK